MSAFQIVAVACLFAIGAQALITTHNYHDTIDLEKGASDACFRALDVHGTDKQISDEDLIHHYYHHKVAHNKKRFIEWIDSSDTDKTVNPDELKTFMEKHMVKLAIHECSFIKSPSLKAFCYSDQLLCYVALVIDHATCNTLFTTIEKADDKDEEIDINEMKEFLNKIDDAKELDFCEADVINMMIEIGGDNQKISAKEWKEYITQEELHDDFRICRTKLVQATCEIEYDPECIVKELMVWTMFQLTEDKIEKTFHVFDTNTNGFIEPDEIKNGITDASDEFIARFFYIMDRAMPEKDGKISYAEFRLFNRDHWVQIEMERDCSSQKKTQADELVCYVGKLKELIIENHRFVWLKVPDLDMVITFEHLDHNGNGRIEKETDLIKEWKWDANAATNLIAEMDGPDKDVHVSLEEFNEAVDEPHMVYATADCMDYILKEKPKRTECYTGELQGLLKNILSRDQVKEFFNHYDTNRCGRITLDEIKAKVNGDVDDADNFMQEMGMGDLTINKREFNWYVKQQRITNMYIDEKCGTEPAALHKVLEIYIHGVFTELETQLVFKELDTDKNWELSDKDCPGHDPLKKKNFLERMDKPDDPDNTVNFYEFWLYFNTPMGPEPRKTILEKGCTITNKKQADEMKCYMDHIWDVK